MRIKFYFSFHEQNNSIFQSQKHSNGSKQMQIKTRRPQKNQDAWMRRRMFFIIFNLK